MFALRNDIIRKMLCLLLCLVVFASGAVSAVSAASSVELPEAVRATSAFLADAETGTVLFEQNADESITPASTTKILTALLVIEAAERGEISLDGVVTVRQELIDGVIYDASRYNPYLTDGEQISVRSLLLMLMMESDCVACDIVADYVCGSVDAFVIRMNQRARELGCVNTNFVNTHGYPADGHYTTARSLYLITAEAMRHAEFREIFGTIKTVVAPTNLSPERKLYNTNRLLFNPEKIESIYCKYFYEYTTGGKTGTSDKSGSCLVSSAEKDGLSLICVVIGAEVVKYSDGDWVNESFTESTRLFEWGFKNYRIHNIAHANQILAAAPVDGAEVSTVKAVAESDVNVVLPSDADVRGVSTSIQMCGQSVTAPVSAGDVLGELTVSYGGRTISVTPLLAMEDVVKLPEKSGASPTVILILAAVVVCVAGYLLFKTNRDRVLLFEGILNKIPSGSKKPSGGKSSSHKSGSRPASAKSTGQRPAQKRPASSGAKRK